MNDTQQDLLSKITKNKQELKLTIGIKEGDKTTIKVYGCNGIELADADYRYEIGSLTKIFTTSFLAKYVAKEQLSLETSLADFFPELNQERYVPTMRRLATHTSGYKASLPFTFGKHLTVLSKAIMGGVNPFRNNTPKDELIAVIKRTALRDQDYPFVYANINYSLLGCVIAEITQCSYTEAMAEWLISELRVSQTSFNVEGVLPAYSVFGKQKENWLWEEEDTAIAAGGLYSTAADLLRFAQLHYESTLDYLALTHKKLASGTTQFDHAFGWKLEKEAPILWHNGGTGCFSSFLGFHQETGKEVVILSNYRSMKIDRLGLNLLTD